MTYLELKAKHEKAISDFPIMFAFNKEQFSIGMRKLGLEENETSKICGIGGGGYILKTDADAFESLFTGFAAENAEARKDDEYLFQMFRYELANHEYNYTWDLEPTLRSLGLTLEEVKANAQMNAALRKAIDDLRADYERSIDNV